MRTLRLALVLLALAVFMGATIAAVDAATASPTVISTPVKKTPTMTPTKVAMPSKMKASSMMGGMDKFSKTNDAAANAVKLEAAGMTKSVQNSIAQRYGKMSNMISLPGMGPVAPQLDHLRQMPAMATINMPDWTTPGIILTI